MSDEYDRSLSLWADAQRASGISSNASIKTLIEGGLHRFAARDAVQPSSILHSPAPDTVHRPAGLLAEVDLGGRAARVVLFCRQPCLTLVDGFIEEDECSALISEARPRLRRSQVVDVDSTSGAGMESIARSSSSMFFAPAESPFVRMVEARASCLAGIDRCFAEPVQIVRYGEGGTVANHQDYFDARDCSTTAIIAAGGQRIATVLVYLNTPNAGGETVFADIQLEVVPHTGHAVHFAFPAANEIDRTLHSGAPVIQGEKWVATVWFRDSPQRPSDREHVV